jgi:hypothetical protein
MNDDKDFNDYIATLPPELKQAIESLDYPQKLQEIVKNNKLLIDQAGKLEIETTLVIAGLEPLNKYIDNLVSNVGISKIQASMVAHDVDELIFKGIRDALKKINDEINKEENEVEEEIIPTQENIIAAVETPENISLNEPSISLSSLQSNNSTPKTHEEIGNGIEIKINNNLPEIAPQIPLPTTIIKPSPKPTETYHQNISPVTNIVESKLNTTVAVPKETVIIEEKTKLPERKNAVNDPYREPAM